MYLLHGIGVHSPVELSAGESGSEPPEVTLVVEEGAVRAVSGEVVARSGVVSTSAGYVITRDGSTWTVGFGAVAAATTTPDDPVVKVTSDPSTPEALLSVLLSGPVMAVVALSRGHQLLHASAVWTNPGSGGLPDVAALMGAQGSGKSTVARMLAGRDAGLFSDDALRIDRRGSDPAGSPAVVAHRGTVRSRLRSPATLEPGTRAGASADGRVTVIDERLAPATGRLRAVFCPLLSPDFSAPRVRELRRPTDVLALAGSWTVGDVRSADLLAERLSWSAALAEQVPVLALEVPWSADRRTAEGRRAVGDTVRKAMDALVVAGSPVEGP